MKLVKKIFATAVLASLFVACSSNDTSTSSSTDQVSSQAESTGESIATDSGLEDRTYVVGLDDTFAPMGFRDDDGELVGFDIDLAKDVAKRLDIKIEFLPIDWAMKETELDSGNIDFIWNGYSITNDRKEKVAFSTPYIQDKQVIVTLKDSGINSKADLKGKTVAVQEDSSALEALNRDQAFLDNLKEEPVEYPTNIETFSDVENGRSDALIIDEVFARYFIKTSGKEDTFKILDEDFGAEDFAVGMRKDDTALVEAVNKVLKEQKDDGTYQKIYDKWLAR